MPAALTTTYLAAAAILLPISHTASIFLVIVAVLLEVTVFVVTAMATGDEDELG